jgi:hypothetical protein
MIDTGRGSQRETAHHSLENREDEDGNCAYPVENVPKMRCPSVGDNESESGHDYDSQSDQRLDPTQHHAPVVRAKAAQFGKKPEQLRTSN